MIPAIESLMKDVYEEKSLPAYLERQQVGDAELFAARFTGRVVYDHAAKSWNIWRGNFWERDRMRETVKLVTDRLAEEYWQAGFDAAKKGDTDGEKAFITRAKSLLKRRYIDEVLKLAESQEGVRLSGDEWDSDPLLLGVTDGVLDLRTGEHRPGRPDEYMRQKSPTNWMGINYPAERWEQFLLEVFDADVELIAFIQRLLGYCLTGLTTEHRLPILWGEGRNGKGTLLETLAYVLGNEITHATQADSLMDTKRDGAGAQPFVYALRGKRLVWASESKQGQKLNAGLVKQLTGGDTITTRTLYSDVSTFRPTHHVLLITNHQPHVDADDQALWDRILLIPFRNRFIDNPTKAGEYKKDPQLEEELKAEASGILAWMVRGCLLWQQEGLNPPQSVLAATDEYRRDEDTLSDFIEERLIEGPDKRAQMRDIYSAYLKWCDEYRVNAMSMKALGKKLRRRYGEPEKKGQYFYNGVGVLL